MQSPARGLKFCGVQAWVACLILAHTASHLICCGFLSLPLPKNTVQSFSGAKDSFLSRFLLHLDVNIVKTMFKWIFFSLIFIIHFVANILISVKTMLNSSSLLLLNSKTFEVNRIVCCFKLLPYFQIIVVV